SEKELQETLSTLRRNGRKYKEDVQRYKGLGEMDADQPAETTMDAENRTLRRITASDAANAERECEPLMGNEVAPSRDFIVAGVAGIDHNRIEAGRESRAGHATMVA